MHVHTLCTKIIVGQNFWAYITLLYHSQKNFWAYITLLYHSQKNFCSCNHSLCALFMQIQEISTDNISVLRTTSSWLHVATTLFSYNKVMSAFGSCAPRSQPAVLVAHTLAWKLRCQTIVINVVCHQHYYKTE